MKTRRGETNPTSLFSGTRTQIRLKTVPLKIKTKAFPTTITEEKVTVALAAEGGSPPYSWEIDGNLPKGLSVNKITGDISGVAKSIGKYAFKAKVTDATGASAKSKDDISFNVIKKYEEPKSTPPPSQDSDTASALA